MSERASVHFVCATLTSSPTIAQVVEVGFVLSLSLSLLGASTCRLGGNGAERGNFDWREEASRFWGSRFNRWKV